MNNAKEIILFALILLLGFFLFQEIQKNKGLRDSIELVDEKLADRIKANKDKSKELEQTFKDYDLIIQAALIDNQDLQGKINDLRTKRQQDESNIDNITDLDSLHRLFSELHKDN